MAKHLRPAWVPRLGFWPEHVWLRLLARLARGYSWVDVDGLLFFGASRHERMLWRMRRRSYERLTTKLFRQSVRAGSTVLDIGAHVGYYTILAAREAGPTGCVYSFECLPENYRFLVHNVRLNGFSSNVRPFPQAASNAKGIVPFFVHGGDLAAGSLSREDGARRIDQVECTTVDDVLAGREVDVVKIDVEGAEIRVLEGMERTLANSLAPIMIIECFPYLLAQAGGSASELIDRIGALGFDVRVIDDKAQALVEVGDELLGQAAELDTGLNRNLYCSRGSITE